MSNTMRYRSFAFVQKVDNLPASWEQDFKDMLCESCYIVHDMDEAEPHVHFFLYYQGKRGLLSVLNEIPDGFGVKHVEPVRSKLAYVRYMLHWGYDDKHQYSWDDLKVIGGMKINLADLASVTFDQVIDLVTENDFSSFYEFVNYCKAERPEYLRFCQTHFQLIDKYITSKIAVTG